MTRLSQTQESLPLCGCTTEELVAKAVLCLQYHAPKDGQPYWGCFSGGKDSVVIKELARLAGVPIEWHYNVTTIDPPELFYFIRDVHPDVSRDKSKFGNFFARVVEKGFPTRRARWCCDKYKESKCPQGRRMVMGIRAAESPRRKAAWKQVTKHWKTGDWVINPIISWTDDDVWRFIRERGVPYSKLYDEGFKRLGCIGCPMGSNREREFERWPRYEMKWRDAFKKLWDRRAGTIQRDGREWFGTSKFKSVDEMWNWWMGEPWRGDDDGCDGLPLD